MRKLLYLIPVAAVIGIAAPLIAQESEEEQKSAFLRFVEDQLSTPERQISINGLEGIISSDISAASVTFSDQEGVWLRMDEVVLNWNQAAILTGRLQINSLTAESIDYIRPGNPAEGMDIPAPESSSFAIPEFPVAIYVDTLEVPSVTFGEAVFGLDSAISLAGSLALEGGSLDTSLDIDRLDEAGGSLDLTAKYAAADRTLDLDLQLTEPEDGVLVNLLQIENRPEISLSIAGAGPIEDLGIDLAFDAGGDRVLAGRGEMQRTSDGFDIDADLGGPIASLIPIQYRPFFGAETNLSADVSVYDAGGFALRNLTIDGGQLDLAMNAATTSDGFLQSLQLDGTIADPSGEPVLLPVAGAGTEVQSASLIVDFDGEGDWAARIEAQQISTAELDAETLNLMASGAVANLSDPATRRVTFNADGELAGISADDPEIERAFGDGLGIGLAGLWAAGEPVELAEARILGQSFEARLAGEIEDFIFDGDISVSTPSIAPFAGLAGSDISGALELAADGTLEPLSGGFDLMLNGSARQLRLDVPAIDGLLSDETSLSGRIARDETGVRADEFVMQSANSRITADGAFSSTEADFGFTAAVNDIALLSDQASGALTATGTARGTEGDIALTFEASIPSGQLVDRNISGARVGFDGRLAEEILTGALTGEAFLGGFGIDLGGDLTVQDGLTQIEGLQLAAGPTVISGDLSRNADGLLNGDLSLRSNDISVAAALLLQDASGAANADISLSETGGNQFAEIDANLSDFEFMDIALDSASAEAQIRDLFNVPVVTGTVTASDVSAAGIDIATIAAEATSTGTRTDFTANAALDIGTNIALAGNLESREGGYLLGLDTATLNQGSLNAALQRPATLEVAGTDVSFDGIRFDVGGGTITATGSSGEALNIDVAVQSLPLSIANAIRPDLGLGGTISGDVRVAGSASSPQVTFDLNGNGISGAPINDLGIGAVAASASGSFAGDTITIASLSAQAAGGLSATGQGRLVLEGSGSDLTLSGSYPLSLASAYLGDRGTQLSGAAQLNARVTGSLANPRISGSVSVNGAEIIDPETALRLRDVTLAASLDGNSVSIGNFSAALAGGGTITGGGSVSLGDGLPADINLALNSARYADGDLFVATASGQLRISGSLLNSPLLSGQIFVEEANVSIPDFGSSTVTVTEVRHFAPPPDVSRTLQFIRGPGGGGGSAGSGTLRLNVLVNAPNRIFIRGDGLEAEVGGSVQLSGSLDNIQPTGAFELIRGRLEILGQRLEFTEGRATLVGDLDPYIDLTARTRAEDYEVMISVTGMVSDPEINFSSVPQLPQDEVLSRLLFQRGTTELSPLQLAKLASAAAELAGGNGSLLGNLRDAIGIDQLDIGTDEEGNAVLQAGAYIQDNVYLSVEAGTEGQSRISLDLDITEDIKARGTASDDGETSIGVFYETDY